MAKNQLARVLYHTNADARKEEFPPARRQTDARSLRLRTPEETKHLLQQDDSVMAAMEASREVFRRKEEAKKQKAHREVGLLEEKSFWANARMAPETLPRGESMKHWKGSQARKSLKTLRYKCREMLSIQAQHAAHAVT